MATYNEIILDFVLKNYVLIMVLIILIETQSIFSYDSHQNKIKISHEKLITDLEKRNRDLVSKLNKMNKTKSNYTRYNESIKLKSPTEILRNHQKQSNNFDIKYENIQKAFSKSNSKITNNIANFEFIKKLDMDLSTKLPEESKKYQPDYDQMNELVSFQMLKTPMKSINPEKDDKENIHKITLTDSEKKPGLKENSTNILDEIPLKLSSHQSSLEYHSMRKENVKSNYNSNSNDKDKNDNSKPIINKSIDTVKNQLKSDSKRSIDPGSLNTNVCQKVENLIVSIAASLKLDLSTNFILDIVNVKNNFYFALFYLNSIFIFRNTTVIGKINTMDNLTMVKLNYKNKDLQILILSNLEDKSKVQVFSVNEYTKVQTSDFPKYKDIVLKSFTDTYALLQYKIDTEDSGIIIIDQMKNKTNNYLHSTKNKTFEEKIKNSNKQHSYTEFAAEKYNNKHSVYILIDSQLNNQKIYLQFKELGSQKFKMSLYSLSEDLSFESNVVRTIQNQLQQKQRKNHLVFFGNNEIFLYGYSSRVEKETIMHFDMDLKQKDEQPISFGLNEQDIEQFDEQQLIVSQEKKGVNRFMCQKRKEHNWVVLKVTQHVSKHRIMNVAGQLYLLDKNQFLNSDV